MARLTPRAHEPILVKEGQALRRKDVGQPLELPLVARWNDNELILFFESRRESWIVYPPRSRYEFVWRPSADAAVVEFRAWSVAVDADQHPVRPRDGCTLHGMDCRASEALQAAVNTGFDPFG